MWILIALGVLFVTANGHSDNTIQNEADLQTSLIPQELNPVLVTEKDEPWQAVMPTRMRRDVHKPSDFSVQLKHYSRIVACVVLVVSAIVEITLYFLDSYII